MNSRAFYTSINLVQFLCITGSITLLKALEEYADPQAANNSSLTQLPMELIANILTQHIELDGMSINKERTLLNVNNAGERFFTLNKVLRKSVAERQDKDSYRPA